MLGTNYQRKVKSSLGPKIRHGVDKLNESLPTKAVVLLSGGMDSSTILYYAKKVHPDVTAVIIDYQQRHIREIEAAKRIASEANIPYVISKLFIPRFKGSPLVDPKEEIPDQIMDSQATTVVPFRNTFFLLHACAVAVQKEANGVYIGAVKEDQLNFPDCRPAFFEAFQSMVDQQELDLNIRYPFVHLSKAKIVQLGEKLGVPWKLTWTCYRGGEHPCGRCDACKERLEAFKVNKLVDPLIYEEVEQDGQ